MSRLTTPGKLSVGGGTKFWVYVTPWPLSLARLEAGKSATKLARSTAWKPSTLHAGASQANSAPWKHRCCQKEDRD